MPKFAGSIGQAAAASISSFSNVGHIFFEIPSTGEYEFWVHQRNTPVGPNQDYAVAWWYGLAPEPPTVALGDFNGDGIVDGADLLAWQRDTTIGDLADWKAGFGTAAQVASSTAVPEPSAFALMLVAACGLRKGSKVAW